MVDSLLCGFRENYVDARIAFRAAAEACDAAIQAYDHPLTGPSGEALATDVAWIGPRDAANVLVAMSGTHGVEGLCGSACQTDWLMQNTALPDGVAVLLIHLINPFGTAWHQRGTEDHVDLNRNFVDHGSPYRVTALYEQLHEAFMCPDRSGPRREAADATIAAFRAEHGEQAYAQAIFGGQYTHPGGMNFGGNAPCWSNRILTEIAASWLGDARRVIYLDYHTGLGPFGYASLILFADRGDPLHRRAEAWLGSTVMPVGGPDVIPVLGHTGHGLTALLPHAEVTPVTVEFGTFDVDTECRVIVDDLWLKNHGERDSPEGRRIKRALVDYFYPSSRDWRELIALRSRQVIAAALAGLGAP